MGVDLAPTVQEFALSRFSPGTPPALRRAMTFPPTPGPSESPLWSTGGEPLIPILRVEEGLGDSVALATWHEALSNTLGIDVPHDLLGLWLFPAHGKAVLLGPAALAADNLAVP